MGHSRWFGPGFMGFGPWSGRTRFFEAGEVRIALLSLLEEGPAHGYELRRAETWEEWGAFVGPEMAEVLGPLGGLAKTAMTVMARSGGDRDVVRRVRKILDEARQELKRVGEEA